MSEDTRKVEKSGEVIWGQNDYLDTWEVSTIRKAGSAPPPWGDESLSDYLKRMRAERGKP